MAQLPAGWLVVTVRGRSWRRVEQGAAQVLEEAEAVWGHGHAAPAAGGPGQDGPDQGEAAGLAGEPAGDFGAARASGAAAKAGTASILAVPGEYAVPASWVQSLRVFSAKSARISAPGTIR
jgi:hypothetical protein